MTTPYTVDDLARAFDATTLQRGRAYQLDGRVRQMTASNDGGTISGTVSGGRRKPYTQVISIRRGGEQVHIGGYCTCPMGRNCKHVAAVLLEHMDRTANSATGGARPQPRSTAGPTGQPSAAIATPSKSAGSETPPPGAALSNPVAQWLDRLAHVASETAGGASKAASDPRSLVYVVNHRDARIAGNRMHASLRPVVVRTRKDGSIADEKTYDPEYVTRGPEQIARYLTPADVDLLRDLYWLKRGGSMNSPDIVLSADALGGRVLAQALATGRTRLGAVDGPALAQGPAVRAEAKWVETADGGQRLMLLPVADASGLHAGGVPSARPAPIREEGPPEPAPSWSQEAGGPEGVPPAGGGAGPAREATVSFDALLPLAPPYYIDIERGRVGAINTGLPLALAAEIVKAPAIARSEAAMVRELMTRQSCLALPIHAHACRAGDRSAAAERQSTLPLPAVSGNVETRAITPVPRLELLLAEARLKPTYSWYTSEPRHRGAFKVPLARLAFDYGGHVVTHADPAQCLQHTEGDKLVLMPRDARAELAAFERLGRAGLGNLAEVPFSVGPKHARDLFLRLEGKINSYTFAATFDEPARFLAFSTDVVPALRAAGWQIEFSDDYPYRIAEGEVGWWADVGEGSGIDWLSFELGIAFDGLRINLIPTLARLIGELPPDLLRAATRNTGDEEWLKPCGRLAIYHTLDDGRLLPLPAERVAPILKALIELVGPRRERLDGGRVKLHRAEAGALAAFAGGGGIDLAWAADAERLIELGRRLSGANTLARIKPPASFRAKLRPYQSQGLSWLDFLRDAGFGGVLADDMGLGKTVQALAFLAREKVEGRLDRPALIIAPTSVLPNWKAEARRFAPDLTVLTLHGPNRAEQFGSIGQHDLVLTTYPLLARDASTLLAQDFHAAILDEAQAIKNPRAAIAGIAHQINARHRLALTGTPLENNLGEVWSLFQFLAPGLLGDESTFRRTFRTPIEKHGDMQAQAFLSRRLKPFMLRRTKDKVARELPQKTEIVEHVALDGAQRDLYETVRAAMHDKVREAIDKQGLAKSHIVFLDALLKLRQVCCDPRLLKLPAARRVRHSAKLERLMEMLPEMVAEGRRILLFSQFTSMLELIEEELGRAGISWVKLTGDTKDREVPVKAFQRGGVPLFLLSLKAGGTGLNLTAADTVIHYDPWWNPAVENQATDRAHRIGQTKPVFVYKLIVEEGIEQAIELLKARKAALADALFAGGTGKPLDLTEADISALFAPLSPCTPQRRAA